MQCTNKACLKIFEKPLELFDGSWHCPRCKQNIYPNEETELEINASNNEKFTLSEIIFNEQWLLNKDKLERTERFAQLKKAVELCEQSAFSFNPYALVNLAYYHQNGYADPNSTLEERMRKAYLLYNTILFNKNALVKIVDGEKDVKSLPDSEFIKLKKIAGVNAYKILAEVTVLNSSKILGRSLNPIDVKNRILNKLKEIGETAVPLVKSRIPKEESLNIDMVFSYICQQNDYLTNPIFGVFLLNSEQIKLLNEKSYFTKNNIKKSLATNIVEQKVVVLYAEAFKEEARGSFSTISNEKELEALAGNSEDSYFLFFCKTGKGMNLKYLKGNAPKKIIKALTKRDDEFIMQMIIKKMMNRYVFTEDDIFYCLKNNDYNQAIEDLIKMCEGE